MQTKMMSRNALRFVCFLQMLQKITADFLQSAVIFSFITKHFKKFRKFF